MTIYLSETLTDDAPNPHFTALRLRQFHNVHPINSSGRIRRGFRGARGRASRLDDATNLFERGNASLFKSRNGQEDARWHRTSSRLRLDTDRLENAPLRQNCPGIFNDFTIPITCRISTEGHACRCRPTPLPPECVCSSRPPVAVW